MYQFKQEWNRNGCFWFDKKIIENKNWAALPKASKSVFPVIACHRNEKGEAFPGELTIAILCGRDEKTVRLGIKGLEGFPDIKIQNYVTKRGRRSKKFFISKPPQDKGRAFPFYKSVLEGGNWLHLSPSAQALYPVMRYFGYFDSEIPELHCEYEEYDSSYFDEAYRTRGWDLCEAELGILAEYAKISIRAVRPALRNLEKYHLIENYVDESRKGWKVFLRSNFYYARDYLNEGIMKRYATPGTE